MSAPAAQEGAGPVDSTGTTQQYRWGFCSGRTPRGKRAIGYVYV